MSTTFYHMKDVGPFIVSRQKRGHFSINQDNDLSHILHLKTRYSLVYKIKTYDEHLANQSGNNVSKAKNYALLDFVTIRLYNDDPFRLCPHSMTINPLFESKTVSSNQ